MNLLGISIVSGLLMAGVPALASEFTAVESTGKRIVLGVRDSVEKGHEATYRILETDPVTGKGKLIALPRGQENREIIALIPAGKELLVVTHWTREQGDDPAVLALGADRRSWKKPVSVDCKQPEHLRIEKSALIFSCETQKEDGSAHSVEKRVSVAALGAAKASKIELPQEEAIHSNGKVRLDGDPYHWDGIKWTVEKTDKVLKFKDLTK